MAPISSSIFFPRLSTTQKRSFVSSLFVLTFVGTVLTVAFPCPAHVRRRGALSEGTLGGSDSSSRASSSSSSRRWLEETR